MSIERGASEQGAVFAPDGDSRAAFRFALAQFGTRHRDTPPRTRLLWALASVILAAGALTIPGIENRTIIAIGMAVTIPINLAWHRLLPDLYNDHTRPVFDGLVVLGLMVASPSTWIPAFVGYTVSIAIAARERIPPPYVGIHIALMASMAVVGSMNDVPYWIATMATLNVVVALRWVSAPTWMDRVVASRFSLVRAQDELMLQTVTDSVTGLANRRAFIDQLARQLESDSKQGTTILMMDLDRFKQINDTLGHAVGDRALEIVGGRLAAAAAPNQLCRLGGDEFGVVLDDPEAVPPLVEAISDACTHPIEIGPIRLSIGVSMGSAVAPWDGSTVSRLMRSADLAMYHAKREGLRHVAFGRELAAMSADEINLSARVTEALRRKEFELWYQPKVDLATGDIVGVEALARWRHPERGILRPGSFIRLVALSDAHEAFTDAVVDSSAAMAASLAAEGYDIPVSINLPMREFMRHDLTERLQQILGRHDVDSSRITIEVTESTIMDDDRAVAGTVRDLADAGFCLSIDDFGTGYSSFERLVDLPLRELKIDRRFVIAAVAHKKERAVVESIVDLGQRLELDIVAEGVETTKERALMRSIGCTTAQGYHWCRPMPGPELLDLVVCNSAGLDPQT